MDLHQLLRDAGAAAARGDARRADVQILEHAQVEGLDARHVRVERRVEGLLRRAGRGRGRAERRRRREADDALPPEAPQLHLPLEVVARLQGPQLHEQGRLVLVGARLRRVRAGPAGQRLGDDGVEAPLEAEIVDVLVLPLLHHLLHEPHAELHGAAVRSEIPVRALDGR